MDQNLFDDPFRPAHTMQNTKDTHCITNLWDATEAENIEWGLDVIHCFLFGLC